MAEYLQYIASQLGVPLWAVFLIIIWTVAWKLPALWISARKRQLVWFIVLAFVNTLGILEILYIFVFSKMHKRDFQTSSKQVSKSTRKQTRKKKRL